MLRASLADIAEQLRQPVFSPAHDLSKERVVQDLLVTAKVFPKVVDILGSNLFLYHGYIVGDRAAPPEATPLTTTRKSEQNYYPLDILCSNRKNIRN